MLVTKYFYTVFCNFFLWLWHNNFFVSLSICVFCHLTSLWHHVALNLTCMMAMVTTMMEWQRQSLKVNLMFLLELLQSVKHLVWNIYYEICLFGYNYTYPIKWHITTHRLLIWISSLVSFLASWKSWLEKTHGMETKVTVFLGLRGKKIVNEVRDSLVTVTTWEFCEVHNNN